METGLTIVLVLVPILLFIWVLNVDTNKEIEKNKKEQQPDLSFKINPEEIKLSSILVHNYIDSSSDFRSDKARNEFIKSHFEANEPGLKEAMEKEVSSRISLSDAIRSYKSRCSEFQRGLYENPNEEQWNEIYFIIVEVIMVENKFWNISKEIRNAFYDGKAIKSMTHEQTEIMLQGMKAIEEMESQGIDPDKLMREILNK